MTKTNLFLTGKGLTNLGILANEIGQQACVDFLVEIGNGASIKETCEKYQVPEETFRDKILKEVDVLG